MELRIAVCAMPGHLQIRPGTGRILVMFFLCIACVSFLSSSAQRDYALYPALMRSSRSRPPPTLLHATCFCSCSMCILCSTAARSLSSAFFWASMAHSVGVCRSG